jgi:hypothetical protein
VVPDPVWTFGRTLAVSLSSVLGSELVGAYFVGSVALGGYVAGESDIDIIGVAHAGLDPLLKRSVIDAVERAIASCPARGLEFTLYRSDVVRAAPDGAAFEVNVNGGQRMERVVRAEAASEPSFWYVLDRGVAHRSGVAIVGPPAEDVFADIDRSVLLRALAESMRWHRTHEGATLYSVLNAARAWRFAVEDVLGSKLDGATWAIQRWHRPAVIAAAVELRHGHTAVLEATDVVELLGHVENVLSAAE